MFSRFIVATDLSPASFAVVDGLCELGTYVARQCLLLLCLSAQEAISTALSYSTKPLEAILREQREILEKQGFEVETRIVPGFAKREINRIAAEEDYSLVVVGSQGHSMVGGALLGGVAHEVITITRRPVLVVRLKMKPGRGIPVSRRRVATSPGTCCSRPISRRTLTMLSPMSKNWLPRVPGASPCCTSRAGRASIPTSCTDWRSSAKSTSRARKMMRKRLPKAGGAEGKAAAPEFAGRRGRLADWYMRMEGAAAGEAVNETYSWLVFDAKGRLDLPAAHAIEADALPSERERIQVLVSGAGGTV